MAHLKKDRDQGLGLLGFVWSVVSVLLTLVFLTSVPSPGGHLPVAHKTTNMAVSKPSTRAHNEEKLASLLQF